MKKFKTLTAVISLLSVTACSTSNQVTIPLNNKPEVDDTYTIIWNGSSEAYRYVEDKWVRAENYDYVFDVVQKRYDQHWKSVKSMHRLHTGYDGKAGARDQTMYFQLAFTHVKDDKVHSLIESSIGDGEGSSDREFRKQQWVMYVKNASPLMPYNKIRISQHYNYEEGLLTETVELVKEKNGKETAFMKNEEKAFIYIKGKLNKAPSTFNQ